MRKNILKIAISAMALLFAMSLALIPGNKVNADKDSTIALGQTAAVDFKTDRTWWFKFTTDKPVMFEMESTGNVHTYLRLYKDKTDSSYITIDYASKDGVNFDLVYYVDAGTYYFKVTPAYDYTDISKNDTVVKLSDVTDTTVIADINATNFPDSEFRSYVSNYDIRPDGKLTQDEIDAPNATDMYIPNSVANIKGIEFFTKLRYLNINNNSNLTSLNISNTELVSLQCYSNKNLASLNVSGCSKLTDIDCGGCALTSLDVSKNKMLNDLDCYGNKLEKLDLSNNKSLQYLTCTNNLLTKLDLSNNKNLSYLYCGSNQLTELNISGCNNLERITCSNNKLTAIDASNLTVLYMLECDDNLIESLKVNDGIESLQCNGNKISSLDISDCTGLYYLTCHNNLLTALDISNCPWLLAVYDDSHKNSEGNYSANFSRCYCCFRFDPSKVTVTTDATSDDKVVELNDTNFPDPNFLAIIKDYDADKDGWLGKKEIASIKTLYVYSNGTKSVKGIEYLTKLRKLTVYSDEVTDLDLSNNTELTHLYNYNFGGELSSLDVSKNTKLRFLLCADSKLTKLDVSNCPDLEQLYCYFNELTSLDLSKNTKLEVLGCFGNNITELDISNCEALVNAYKNGEYTDYETTSYRGKKTKLAQYTGSDGNFLGIDLTTTVTADKPTPTPTATPTAAPTTVPTTAPTAAPTGSAADVTLKIDKETANVVCGKTLTLKATLTGSSEKITWKTSDKKVATVDANGKISAKMAGAVTVTATAAGKSVECKVTVLYKDVTKSKDFWFAPTNYLTAKGVVKGYDNQTKFKPANKCTRAQMVTFIWRLMGEPAPKAKTCKFKDVKKTDYFYKACIWGNEKKIVEGYKDGTFGPQIVCARRHAVTFLWRLAGKPAPKTTKNPFKDVKKSDYFYKATLWASEKKILAGYSDGTFKPNGDCLRRQMVTFLYKYDKYINGKG